MGSPSPMDEVTMNYFTLDASNGLCRPARARNRMSPHGAWHDFARTLDEAAEDAQAMAELFEGVQVRVLDSNLKRVWEST